LARAPPDPVDQRSVHSLAGVHPDLVKVMTFAYGATKQPFLITSGLRLASQEAALVAKGASTTQHSRHLAGAGGYGCAVDVSCFDARGQLVSADPHPYTGVAAAVLAASHELHIPVVWGGDWVHFKDWGHFELSWRAYP